METKLQFADGGRNYRLSSAILIYTDDGRNETATNANNTTKRGSYTAATVHDVTLVGGQGGSQPRPVIQPGQPVSVSALEHLMVSLGRNHGAGFIPEHVLSVGLDRMAWWCPAGRRRIWFRTYKEDDARKELRALNGKFVHHPPLLFVVKGGLNVFALLEDKRPKHNTQLHRAPYWNLSEGHMCNGDMNLPPVNPGNIHGFEAAFFNSAFTHGRGEGLTHHKGGHTGLWTELAKRKTKPDAKFWRSNLIKSGKTINEMLK